MVLTQMEEGVKGVTESAAGSGEGLEGEEGLDLWVLGSIPFLAVARIKDSSSQAVGQEDVSGQHRLRLSVSKIFR
jgi:hypothetical protein